MIVICKSCGKELETDLSSGVVICDNCHESTPITPEHLIKVDLVTVNCCEKFTGFYCKDWLHNCKHFAQDPLCEARQCVSKHSLMFCGNPKAIEETSGKRDSDKDGFLPLTKEELTEFNGAFYPSLEKPVSRLQIVYDPALAEVQCETVKNNYEFWFRIQNCRAIVWLATRFNLDRIK